MGTTIKATAVSADPALNSSIRHASTAATRCLERAGISTDQVDLLINAGVYRDRNMAEPAMAALIQKEVGINLDYIEHPTPTPGFSFDLMNGACGMLNAVQVADAYLRSGNAEYALVVSGDAHPGNGSARDKDTHQFPYAASGAAMLLQRGLDTEAGFGRVRVRVSAGARRGVEGYLPVSTMGTEGRRRITVQQDDDYVDQLVALAAEAVREYVQVENVDLTGTLLVTSRPTPDFAIQLAQRLGVPEESALTATGVEGDPHSSALTFAYEEAVASGQVRAHEQLLFVAAGAGMTTACALYRPEPQS
ncbi:hypothetical protein GCM10012275_34030 [Longimycelium tulufanense]|uniref:Uncharacterized protein n=1 Tax=Longimycelium tulufanense TaxID=907463 RepID=A0A8J3FX90_9PSEU|nr:3-oxoacyl-[acyl-carrier-protein] synthase III C-terminal domain-containing protein [Longimycelium tulufanense]GGM60060.1 hypothetical protein GCM10012275_34030 [Longimycelium tulufanense]